MADPDTWQYLSPAVRKLTDAAFVHTYGRNFLYPGFLYLILSAFGRFRAIALVQHLLGLSAGAVLLLIWRQLRIFVPDSLVDPQLHDIIGLVGTPFFYSPRTLFSSKHSFAPTALVLTCPLLASVRPGFWFSADVVSVPVAGFFLRQGWWRQKTVFAVAIVLSCRSQGKCQPAVSAPMARAIMQQLHGGANDPK